jgi:predicted dehydrogenase
VKAGVIGLGVGEQHVLSYNRIEGVEVAAVADLDVSRASAVADRHAVPEYYQDYRKITEHPDIEVVSICSFDNFHAEHLLSAFRHGKHVMVEKPVVLHKEDAEAVYRAFVESGRKMTSNLILRESPRFIAVRDMIRAGEFGDIFYIEGDYLHDILWKITGGWRGEMPFYCTFYGGGIHLVDLMRWLLDQEVRTVTAMSNDVLTRTSSYKFPDFFAALLGFESGAIGKCATALGPARTKFHALNVYGSELSFINDMPSAKIFSGDSPEDERAMDAAYPGMRKGDLLPEFINAIRTDVEPEVNHTDIFRVMDVCFAVWEAAQTGRRVDVDYLV